MKKTKVIDMLGKPCPIPVIEAKKALTNGCATDIEIVVDNIVAVQNLEKMAKGMGFDFFYNEKSKEYYSVFISNDGNIIEEQKKNETTSPQKQANYGDGLAVLITDEKMGTGSEELGKILIKGFIFSLTELEVIPSAVMFLNAGVKLTVDGANTLEDIKKLESMGCKVRSCGTCLNFYGTTEKLAVGQPTDMYDITTTLAEASSTIVI